MADQRFSDFTQKNNPAETDYLVGYSGNTNVKIPANAFISDPGVPLSEVITRDEQTLDNAKAYTDSRVVDSADKTPLAQYVLDELPAYIKNIQQSIDTDSILITTITDTHTAPLRDDRMQSLYAFAEITRQLNPMFAVHLGDIFADADYNEPPTGNNERWFAWANEVFTPFADIKPLFCCAYGNHDSNLWGTDGNKLAAYVDGREFFMATTQPHRIKSGMVDPSVNQPYYYHDFEAEKIRVIVLNLCDFARTLNTAGTGFGPFEFYGIRQEQMDWLVNTALNLQERENYKVIVMSHIPPKTSLNVGPGGVGTTVNNETILDGVLTAFVEGSTFSGSTTGQTNGVTVDVDFTSQGPRQIVCYLYGHIHSDNVYRPTGLVYQPIGFTCALPKAQDPSRLPVGAVIPTPRTPNTVSGLAVTTVVYDPKAEAIKTFRFGAGEDYTVSLNPAKNAFALQLSTNGFSALGIIPTRDKLVSSIKEIRMRFKIADITRAVSQFLLFTSTGTDQRFYARPALNSGGRMVYGFGANSGIIGSRPIVNDTVHELVLSIANNIMTATVDGLADKTLTVDADFALASDMLFGQSGAEAFSFFDGVVYELKITNTDDSVYAHYTFQDGSGPIATDSSGNNRHMTLRGNYEWVTI